MTPGGTWVPAGACVTREGVFQHAGRFSIPHHELQFINQLLGTRVLGSMTDGVVAVRFATEDVYAPLGQRGAYSHKAFPRT